MLSCSTTHLSSMRSLEEPANMFTNKRSFGVTSLISLSQLSAAKFHINVL